MGEMLTHNIGGEKAMKVATSRNGNGESMAETHGTGVLAKADPAAPEKKTRRLVRMEFDNLEDEPMSMLTATIGQYGLSTLIHNRKSEVLKRQLAKKHSGENEEPRVAKNPELLFLNSMHVIGRRPKSIADVKNCRYGIPCIAIKEGLVRAITADDDKKMTWLRSIIYVEPDAKGSDGTDLVEIKCKNPPKLHFALASVGQGVPDTRYRAEFDGWEATVRITYLPQAISGKRLLNLLRRAGRFIGLLDWRLCSKKSSGSHGAYAITHAIIEEWVGCEDDKIPVPK